MQISSYSDYSIRVLIHVALCAPNRVTVDDVASTFNLSRHYLVKIVHELGLNGYLNTHRGIGGGFTLAKSPENICIGTLIRDGEKSSNVIDCFDKKQKICRIYSACRLKGVLDEAADAFFTVLDRYTLADLLDQSFKMKTVLGI